MKRILLAIFVYCTFTANAQIPVVDFTIAPHIGDAYTYQLDTIPEHLLNVSPGQGGANVSWDFSNSIIPSGDTIATNYVATSTLPLANAFPLCNIGTINSESVPNFFDLNQQGVEFYGTVSGGYVFYYSNPMKLLFFPTTYQDAFVDSFAASYPQFPTYLQTTGFINAESDGYGTLAMPNGNIYQNVLRVKYTLNIFNNFIGVGIDSTVEEYYDWYGNDISFPILQIGTRITNPSAVGQATDTLKYIRIKTAQSLTTPISSNSISDNVIYPNPANAECNIVLPSSTDDSFVVSVYDLSGRLVMREMSTKTSTFYKLNTSTLNIGIYSVKVQGKNSLVTYKLSKI